jgi:hypothetical protein
LVVEVNARRNAGRTASAAMARATMMPMTIHIRWRRLRRA